MARAPRVLVVGGDGRAQERLGAAGWAVRSASQGAQALALCRRQLFEAVLLDLRLPDMSGLALLAALREEPGFRAVPILVHEARDPEALAEALRRADLGGASAPLRSARSEVLELPEPALLRARRRRWTARRFGLWVVGLLLAGALLVNVPGAVLLPSWLLLSPAEAMVGVGLLLGLPMLGLIGATFAAQRQDKLVLEAARRVLGAEIGSRGWLEGPLAVLLALILPPAVVLSGLQPALSCAALGILMAAIRRQADRCVPGWGLLVVGGWAALGGLWAHLLAPHDLGLALCAGISWLLLSPAGGALRLVRSLVVRLAERGDLLGSAARAWAIFLPAAEAARILRRRGDLDGALSTLMGKLEGSLRGRLLVEALVEAGEILLELGDRRALGMFAAASRLWPVDAAPLLGLARALRDEDPPRAWAYAQLAEENAARSLGRKDPAAGVLREELERAALPRHDLGHDG
jgi:CheY-like chemotaxis protein